MPAARLAALATGEIHYQGAPCRVGHSGLRFAKDGGKCVECVRLRCESWRARNPAHAARDWRENKGKYQQRAADLKARDPLHWAAVRARINARRRDKRVEEARKWHEANKDRAADYRKARREAYATHARNRRARKAAAGGTHTVAQLDQLLFAQRHKCALCKCCIKASRHVDHIMPIARGGSNAIENLQWLCPRCNLSKNDKLPHEFAQTRGMLL